jgi:drug/metabolite transporter (DMT)-like permease
LWSLLAAISFAGFSICVRAAAFLYLSPLFSAAFSIGWLGEQLAWYHLAGIAAIFSGLIILGRRGPTRERPELV